MPSFVVKYSEARLICWFSAGWELWEGKLLISHHQVVGMPGVKAGLGRRAGELLCPSQQENSRDSREEWRWHGDNGTCCERRAQQGSAFQKSDLVPVRTCLPFSFPEDGYGLVSCCCGFYECLVKLDLGSFRLLPTYALLLLNSFEEIFLAGKHAKNRNVGKSCTKLCILNTVTLLLSVRLFPKHVRDRGKPKKYTK